MRYRLSKIYTRAGDEGKTSLADGSCVDKDHERICAFGDIDELNSLLGLLITYDLDEKVKSCLFDIQHVLFDLGGELAIPDSIVLDDSYTHSLEQLIDSYNATLAPLEEFILPGGTKEVAICHCARSVCRRAERQLVSLSKTESVNPASLKFLNRLSDLLFVLARVLTYMAGKDEVYWQSNRIKNKR